MTIPANTIQSADGLPPDRLGKALQAIYSLPSFSPRAWVESDGRNFIDTILIERSIALLAPRLGGELLDVGCGEQPYAAYFSHVKRKRACDFNAKRGNVDFECPADKIPLPDGSLDSILCTEVLEHVPDPAAVWREFNRLLRPGGAVLLTTPMYWPTHEVPYDFFRYPEHGLRALARNAGFQVAEMIPRGGTWALFGQVVMHAMPGFYFGWQRSLSNRFFLKLDAWRCSPRLTIGWTMLAIKNGPVAG